MMDCPVYAAREEILRRWETKSRERFPAATIKATDELRDHLPHILLSLCDTLNGHDGHNLRRLSRVHGQQRFSFGDYTLAQVIGEYDLLKEIVFEYLEVPDLRLTIKSIKQVCAFFDEAAKTAATEFADLRQNELKCAIADIESSRSDLQNFAAIVAHDMRSPLSTISGFCELLDRENDPTLQGQFIGKIAAIADRTIQLIDRLLDYSKLGHGRLNEERVDLDAVLRSTTMNLRSALQKRGATISSDSLGKTSGDPYLIGQVFQNLISNSLKFARNDVPCEIKIFAESAGGLRKRICFVDNGVGFPTEKSKEIFKPFTRAHSEREYTGVGLGLAICQRVVELHGGTIEAVCHEGVVGSKVCFTLSDPSAIGSALQA